MKEDQVLRGMGIGGITVAFISRLATVGNGTIDVFGHPANPFALFVLAVVVLAAPEVVDKFPLGPTRK